MSRANRLCHLLVVKDEGCGGRDEAIARAGDVVTVVTVGGSSLRTPNMPDWRVAGGG